MATAAEQVTYQVPRAGFGHWVVFLRGGGDLPLPASPKLGSRRQYGHRLEFSDPDAADRCVAEAGRSLHCVLALPSPPAPPPRQTGEQGLAAWLRTGERPGTRTSDAATET
jgi:hypothetical protein